MRSTFKPGEVLYTRPAGRAVKPGDVVVYEQGGVRVVHRVVSVETGGVRTRGDNNPSADQGVIPYEQILGVVEKAEDWDQARIITGGEKGAAKAATRWKLQAMLNQLRPIIGAPYRWLKGLRLVPKLWRPRIRQISVIVERREIVKYLVNGRTVATFDPACGCFTCRRPYDLVILPPGDRE